MKILAIGDTADNIYTLQKFAKNFSIHLINFPRKQAALMTLSDEVEFFDSLLIHKQVKKIEEIKEDYDMCIVMSWAGARVAYLAGINYIMYFVGGDIMTPPFLKNAKLSYAKEASTNLNFLERSFYKKVFDTAIACITLTDEYFFQLKRFRNDAIRLDRIAVDTTFFNPNIEAVKLEKPKFTFLSAQRMGLEKGTDLIWKALKLTKSDFRVLQVNWFIENTNEEKKFKNNLLMTKPEQIEFIPLIKRSELGSYFKYADVILGQMRIGVQGGIERDAAYCKKPVLSYCDKEQVMTIEEEEIIPPFLPNSNDPRSIAENLDKIVEDVQFREELAKKEYEYIQNLSNPEFVIKEWEDIFKKYIKIHEGVNRKTNHLKLKFEKIIAENLEKIIYKRKMRKKNIESWGETEYKKLIK
jgi:glycosyltransferase involved in cell wall biosynthesis